MILPANAFIIKNIELKFSTTIQNSTFSVIAVEDQIEGLITLKFRQDFNNAVIFYLLKLRKTL